MENKRPLWKESNLYGKKMTVMERKRRVMENKVHLWKKSSSLATLWKKKPNLWEKKNTSLNYFLILLYINAEKN